MAWVTRQPYGTGGMTLIRVFPIVSKYLQSLLPDRHNVLTDPRDHYARHMLYIELKSIVLLEIYNTNKIYIMLLWSRLAIIYTYMLLYIDLLNETNLYIKIYLGGFVNTMSSFDGPWRSQDGQKSQKNPIFWPPCGPPRAPKSQTGVSPARPTSNFRDF